MGYLRDKYTKEYLLSETQDGRSLPYGVYGIGDFKNGSIRAIDKDILERLEFRKNACLILVAGVAKL